MFLLINIREGFNNFSKSDFPSNKTITITSTNNCERLEKRAE